MIDFYRGQEPTAQAEDDKRQDIIKVAEVEIFILVLSFANAHNFLVFLTDIRGKVFRKRDNIISVFNRVKFCEQVLKIWIYFLLI